MKFHQLFLASFFEPKKLAAFRMLSIGKVFNYVFIFVILFTVISFTRFALTDTSLLEHSPELFEHGEKIGLLIYPIAFIMQLVINIFYIFIRISIIAYFGILLLKLMKKRGDFLHIWRTAAISLTVPILLAIFLDFIPDMTKYSLLLTSLIHITYIIFAVKYYPKKIR